MLVTISVTGKVSQKKLRPRHENKNPRGTNRTTVRSIVSSELLNPKPTAWKNIGKVSEVTRGKKLIAIIRKPIIPISITFSLEENTLSSGAGKSSKHSMPNPIKTMLKIIEAESVFRHLSRFFAA